MSKNQPLFAHLGDKKTQFRADDKFRFRKSCRDKIESNLQSPNVQERAPPVFNVQSPAFGGVNKLAKGIASSNRFFREVFAGKQTMSVGETAEMAAKANFLRMPKKRSFRRHSIKIDNRARDKMTPRSKLDDPGLS